MGIDGGRMEVSKTVPVTVGLPVYNGEAYVANAIESLLGQTFTDFELIIADNASTDGTQAICEQYAAADSRVRYVRKGRNEGAVTNYMTTLELASGSLFKWAAHDDVCKPAFLEHCVRALENDGGAVLAFPRAAWIDQEGDERGTDLSWPELNAQDPAKRLRGLADLNRRLTPLFGVIRREVLEAVRPHGRFPGADRILLVELALRGRFVEVPDGLLEFRVHEAQYSSSEATSQFKTSWWSGGQDGDRPAPTNWKRLLELYRAVAAAPLTTRERRACDREIARWVSQHWKRLALDAWLLARFGAGRARCLLGG